MSFFRLPSTKLLAIVAALNHLRRRYADRLASEYLSAARLHSEAAARLDPGMYEAFLSHVSLDYPAYEILFGVADPSDPAIPEVLRLKEQFPAAQIQLIIGHEAAPNGKVGVLSYLGEACALSRVGGE